MAISAVLEQKLIADAKDQYINSLPYHNWSHALDVITNAAELCDRASKFGAQVDRSLLLIAAAWHDADYYLPVEGESRTREERSADLVHEKLTDLSEEKREIIKSAIIDTTVGKESIDSTMGILLHFADIGYFAYPDHAKFLDRMQKWQQENNYSDEEVVKMTRKFGRYIVDEAHKYLPVAIGNSGSRKWIDRVEANITQLQSHV